MSSSLDYIRTSQKYNKEKKLRTHIDFNDDDDNGGGGDEGDDHPVSLMTFRAKW